MMNKNYWNNVFRVRNEICDMMMALGVSGEIATDSVNPFYNQITDNGGIGLEFYYGLPSTLYTPLGYIKIIRTSTCDGSESEIVQKLVEDYGLVMVVEERTSFIGLFGPVYAITKLPWTDKTLPIFEYLYTGVIRFIY